MADMPGALPDGEPVPADGALPESARHGLGAKCALLQKAFSEAESDEFIGTDEASLLERAGIEVAVVAGSPRNFKITQPGDLELAEFYLEQAKA